MKYYIGIDGGGTKTRSVLANENLKVIKSSDGLASNPLTVGFEISAERLFTLIKRVAGNKKIECCVIGLAGAGRKEHADLLYKSIKSVSTRKKFKLPPLKILTDIEITLEGAFNGLPGALLIAGTGSILFAKDNNNNLFRVGGYGRLIGDEGSGYSIGRKALSSISRSFDGRKSATGLSNYFSKRFKVTGINSLISLVNSKRFNIADLAKLIITLAAKKDKECIRILNEEIKELIQHIKALSKRKISDQINLSLQGNLLATSNYYSRKLQLEIRKQFPEIKIVKAKQTPELGAVLIAKKYST